MSPPLPSRDSSPPDDYRAQARQVAGDIPRERFERAVEAAAIAVCGHRSYRMIAAEVLAAVDHAGAVRALEDLIAAVAAPTGRLRLGGHEDADLIAELLTKARSTLDHLRGVADA